MIVPMKKVAILVQSKDSHVSVERLRELGVLHVEHKQLPKGDNVSALKEDLNLIDSCIRTLFQEEFSSKTITPDAQELSDWKFTARHIVDLGKRVNQLKDYAFTLTNRISSWGSWGDFQPESIQGLKDKGVLIRLYQIPVKEIKNLQNCRLAIIPNCLDLACFYII